MHSIWNLYNFLYHSSLELWYQYILISHPISHLESWPVDINMYTAHTLYDTYYRTGIVNTIYMSVHFQICTCMSQSRLSLYQIGLQTCTYHMYIPCTDMVCTCWVIYMSVCGTDMICTCLYKYRLIWPSIHMYILRTNTDMYILCLAEFSQFYACMSLSVQVTY